MPDDRTVLSWIEIGKNIAAFLVAIGVAGEFLGDFIAKPYARRMETAREKELETLRNETEKLRGENLKIAAATLPRVIVFGDRNGDKDVREPRLAELRKYSGVRALVQSIPDHEAETLALNIVELLRQSGWNVTLLGPVIPPGLLTDGVRLTTHEQSMFDRAANGGKGGLKDPKLYKVSEESNAARALESFLLLDLGPPFGPSFFGVRWDPEQPDPKSGKYRTNIPKGSILISVGERPAQYLVSEPPSPKPDPSAK